MMDVTYSPAGVLITDSQGNTKFLWWPILDQERNKIRFANSILVEFYWDFGRMGDFHQSVILDKDEWAALKLRMLGSNIYFGEIAGKHSEIQGVLKESDIVEKDDIDTISGFYVTNGYESGNVDFINTFLEAEKEESYE